MSYFYMDFNEAIQLDTLWEEYNMMLNFSSFILFVHYNILMEDEEEKNVKFDFIA